MGVTDCESRAYFKCPDGSFSFPIASIGGQTCGKLVSNNKTKGHIKKAADLTALKLKPLEVCITEAEHATFGVSWPTDSHSRILQDTALGTDGLSGWREQVLASANANHAKQVRFRVYMPSP